MNKLCMWRLNCDMTQKEVAEFFEMPPRTWQAWDQDYRQPPHWAERLIIKELMDLAEKRIEERAEKRMANMKSDVDGNRPVGSWATIKNDGCDEFIELYPTMKKAINDAESGMTVAYIICNKSEDGLITWYEDKNGKIESDYDYVEWEVK